MAFPPLQISGQTKITGLIGWPVEHTLSPALHNYVYRRLKLDFCYLPFPVRPADLPAALVGLKALNLAGVNVTIPHKEAVLPLLDRVDDFAALAGAVNTVKNDNGRLTGSNTDGPGLVNFLGQDLGWRPAGKKVLILGAGGAARAIAAALLLAEVKSLAFTEIVPEKTQALTADLAEIAGRLAQDKKIKAVPAVIDLSAKPSTLKDVLTSADLILNATPAGMPPWEKDSPLEDFSALHPGQLAVDLIYNPTKTIFLDQAAQRGAQTANGLGLLIHQAVLSFEVMTGQKIEPKVMAQGLQEKA